MTRVMQLPAAAVAATACLALVGCIAAQKQSDDCDIGTERCECTKGGSCDPGLSCLSGVCVAAGATSTGANDTGQGTGTGAGDTGGSTGSDGTGGTGPADGTSTGDDTGGTGDRPAPACDLAAAEGTVVDTDNCLMWAKDHHLAAAANEEAWLTASKVDAECAQLSFAGFDDWRTPAVGDVRTIIRGCPTLEVGGACKTTNTCTADLFGDEGHDTEADCYNSACRTCWDDKTPAPEGGCFWDPADWGTKCDWVWTAGVAGTNPEETDPDWKELRYYVKFPDGLLSIKPGGQYNLSPLCVRGPGNPAL